MKMMLDPKDGGRSWDTRFEISDDNAKLHFAEPAMTMSFQKDHILRL